GNNIVRPFYGYLENDPDDWGPISAPSINECVWLAETNWEGPAAPFPLDLDEAQEKDLAYLPPNTVYVIEFEEVSISPHRTWDFTYFSCVDEHPDWEGGYIPPEYDADLHGFYCPYEFESPNASGGVSDMHFQWDETKQDLDVRPALPGDDVGDALAAYFGSEYENMWVLPYDSDAVCEATLPTHPSCQSEWGRHWFISPQVGYVYTFAPVHLDLREEWSWTWTLNSVEEVRLPPGTQIVVEGDRVAEGVTFTQAEQWHPWGGIVGAGTGTDPASVTLDDVTVEHA